MSENWERSTLGAERTWARAVVKLLLNAPPGSSVEDIDGKPVLRRPRKTITALRAQMQATASRWRVNERSGS